MKKDYPREVFLNGQWLPSEHATVSVFDRGLLLGDGIYEVIPFYQGKLFTIDEHMRRFQDGLANVGIAYDVDTLRISIGEAIERSGYLTGIVYMQVTRGAAPRTHYFPEDTAPTVLLYAAPFNAEGFEQRLVNVLLSEDFRWQRCDIKSTSLMANVLANNAAHDLGLAEHVFHRGGHLTEGSHTSVFLVRHGMLFTHPRGPHILPGITREVVISIAREIGIEAKEEAVAVSDLNGVEEAFLTGTTTQVTAIGSFFMNAKEVTVGKGGIGPVTRQIQTAFSERIRAL
ncbi:aminotransferase class IV [Parapedobacter sp. DT-150]|uniref:aminotransferase class IV n=1 Tax=Parapedobacter sp. DT-150 TaxID=3396162 RepID=UPI003F1D77E2